MEDRTAVASFWIHLAVDIVCVLAIFISVCVLFPSMRQGAARVDRLEKSVDDRFEVADRRFEKLEALATKWADEQHRNHAEQMRLLNSMMVSQTHMGDQTDYITGWYRRAELRYQNEQPNQTERHSRGNGGSRGADRSKAAKRK